MEVKKWVDYSKDEKMELLVHWFQSYGRLFYSVNEFQEFVRLVDMDADLMMDVAVGSFSNKSGFQAILVGLRTNSLAAFLNSILAMRNRPGYEEWFRRNSQKFLTEIVRTYNNPEFLERVFYDADLERQTRSIVDSKCGRL